MQTLSLQSTANLLDSNVQQAIDLKDFMDKVLYFWRQLQKSNSNEVRVVHELNACFGRNHYNY